MPEPTEGPGEVQRTARLGLPGWRVQHNHYDHRSSVVVATVDSEANARLIAAAPDLLEVLSIFVDCYPAQIEPLKQRARHLIAKAKGE